ncbi:MAG: acyl-CoA desaturase [Cytophagales bacterium]|nr:acyl-CoA desaturase [Cytophagales bacterium]
MRPKTVKFSKAANSDFNRTLRQRVNEYFIANNISKYADSGMVWKTIFMTALYFIPYAFIISGIFINTWIIFSLWIIMGIGIAGIGLSVTHDAIHGAYSPQKKVNMFLGYLLNIIGGSAANWEIQHNVLHHRFTNIDGFDEDITPVKVLRFSPHQKRYFIHRIQHIYVWFFYGLITLSWVLMKDYDRIFKYEKMGMFKEQNKTLNGLLIEIAITKLFYYFYMIVIPMLVSPVPWWQTLAFFFCMHFVAGLMLGCVFQPAHVMQTSEYPVPDLGGNVKNDWSIHQILTTANYSPSSKLLYWFVGGLNYQIEHHLFPNICHIHYKKLSTIVRETALEYGLPYHSQPSFTWALWYHAKMLRYLGTNDKF